MYLFEAKTLWEYCVEKRVSATEATVKHGLEQEDGKRGGGGDTTPDAAGETLR